MSQLQKARLIPNDPAPPIEFMFNPTELTYDMSVEVADNPGARSENSGKSKTSFSNINPVTLTISNIIFDTYQDGTSVVDTYIASLKKAVEFAPGTQRTPIYTFVWGDRILLRRCFLEQLNYKLTMFLPSGIPVRAKIDSLTLKEADEGSAVVGMAIEAMNAMSSGRAVSNKLREKDSIESRSLNSYKDRVLNQLDNTSETVNNLVEEQLGNQFKNTSNLLDNLVDRGFDYADKKLNRF
nr:hypothetical protein [Baaleninema simplex]